MAYKIEEASTVTSFEYISIRASIEAAFKDDFNCSKCMKRNGASEGRAAAKGSAKRKHKGCFDFTTRTYLLDNIVYKSCIGNYTIEGLGYYFDLLKDFNKGVYPYKGSVGSQPNKLIEVLSVIEQMRREASEKLEGK